jgi:hypothetical protein
VRKVPRQLSGHSPKRRRNGPRYSKDHGLNGSTARKYSNPRRPTGPRRTHWYCATTHLPRPTRARRGPYQPQPTNRPRHRRRPTGLGRLPHPASPSRRRRIDAGARKPPDRQATMAMFVKRLTQELLFDQEPLGLAWRAAGRCIGTSSRTPTKTLGSFGSTAGCRTWTVGSGGGGPDHADRLT